MDDPSRMNKNIASCEHRSYAFNNRLLISTETSKVEEAEKQAAISCNSLKQVGTR